MHFFSIQNTLIAGLFSLLCADAFPSPSESELALVSPTTNETTSSGSPAQESSIECYGQDPYAHRAQVTEDACVGAILKLMREPGLRDSRYFTWNKFKDDRGVFRQAMWNSYGCYVYVRADLHRAIDQFSLMDVAESARSITNECVERTAAPRGGQKEIGRAGNGFYVGVAGTIPVGEDPATDGNSTVHGDEVDAASEVGLPQVMCWPGQSTLQQIDTSDCDFVIERRLPRIAPEMELKRWGYTSNTDIRLPKYWGYHQCYTAVTNPNTAVVDIFTTLELELTARRIVNQCTGPGTNGLGGYCAIGNGKGFYATVQNPPPGPGESITLPGLGAESGSGSTTEPNHYSNGNDPSQSTTSISLTSRDKGFTMMFSDLSLLRKRAFRAKFSTAKSYINAKSFVNAKADVNTNSSSTSTTSDFTEVACIPPSATSATPTPAQQVNPEDCRQLVENLYSDLLNQAIDAAVLSPNSSSGVGNPENYYPIIPQTTNYGTCFAVLNSTIGNGNPYTPPTLPSGGNSSSDSGSNSGTPDAVIGGGQPRPVPLVVPQPQQTLPSIDAATFFNGAFEVVKQCLLISGSPLLGGAALLAPMNMTITDVAQNQSLAQIYLTFSAFDAASEGSAAPEVVQGVVADLIASVQGNTTITTGGDVPSSTASSPSVYPSHGGD